MEIRCNFLTNAIDNAFIAKDTYIGYCHGAGGWVPGVSETVGKLTALVDDQVCHTF